jgi:hypothetical protein
MLDAGVDLRDVQIAARHADPRTTMRYDRARQNLDRHPNYILAPNLHVLRHLTPEDRPCRCAQPSHSGAEWTWQSKVHPSSAGNRPREATQGGT